MSGGRHLDNRALGNRVRSFHGSREGGWTLTQVDVVNKQAVWSLKWEGPGEPPPRAQAPQGELPGMHSGHVDPEPPTASAADYEAVARE